MKILQLFFMFIFLGVQSQSGFQLQNSTKTTIPFQLINNLIFIPVNINGAELTFLLDSGVAETILFSLDNKQVNFNNVEKIKFSGLGENMDIEGLQSINNSVSVGKDFVDKSHTIFIILDEGINFSSHVGIPVNGIIGYHFFRNHPVQIDFIKKKITIYNTSTDFEKKKKRFEEFPISIEKKKPYLEAEVEMTTEKKPSKLLLDLGNSDAIWLFPSLIKNFVYNRPNIDDFLGRGFNGDIFGKRSRIHSFSIGKFNFEKPLAAMPDEYSIQHLTLVKDRKGSIGNDILRRFLVIFDYPNQKIYFRKNKHFSDPFLFNKSGLDIKHDGMMWEKDLVKVETQKKNANDIEVYNHKNTDSFQYKFVLKPQYSVAGCRKNSPCEKAGLLKDDKIISIKGKKAGDLTLDGINRILKDHDGTFVEFEIERNGQNMKLGLYLEDPIPYQENQN